MTNPIHFAKVWSDSTLREKQGSQAHFLHLCELLGHPKPQEVDPTGEWFCFEKGVTKEGGGDGFADVWKKGFFGWEYKGKHKDLDAAYQQLLRYRDQLENPPLLIVSDMDRIIIRTNYTGTKAVTYEVSLANLAEPRSLEILRCVFENPVGLRPGTTSHAITEKAAANIGLLAEKLGNRGMVPQSVARFLDRIVFCLFAEDVGLLPKDLFTRILEKTRDKPDTFLKSVSTLFEAMAEGGLFGADEIRNFDGTLFESAEVLVLNEEEIGVLLAAARLDWDAVDPSVFGTLFERGLDPSKRSQLGAHYTSRADIETLIEPVVLKPLREEWEATKAKVAALLDDDPAANKGKKAPKKAKDGLQRAKKLVWDFQDRLATIKVLDPACGSGNFLYVTLQKIKDLEKELLNYASERFGASLQLPKVGAHQFFGIEINEYAFYLAQLSLWIGFLQWSKANGFGFGEDPVLKPLGGFRRMDAILDLSDPENPKEPEWPSADFIVGNPPFLGDKKMRSELGDAYVGALKKVYEKRIPAQSDLCCYWFEKARAYIVAGTTSRAGLLATQSIRGGASREVLKRIKETGEIYYAIADRQWILDGANVHVSMVAFDANIEKKRFLNEIEVSKINSNLTSESDTTMAGRLVANAKVSFIGASQHGPFEIDEAAALVMLRAGGNPNSLPNSDVIRPIVNAKEIAGRNNRRWVIFFEPLLPLVRASQYQEVFEYVRKTVKPIRDRNHRKAYREGWWILGESRPALVSLISPRPRFLVTSRVGKHRVFDWLISPALPSDALVAFGREDDFFFGVLHSRPHEVWGLKLGTRLETRPRYTPTTCFETFPMPDATEGQKAAIAAAAKELDDLRQSWLNPVEWTRTEVLEFPGSADGPWARYVQAPDARGIGLVRYPRLAPKDEQAGKLLAKRTLTNLYNQRPAWLAQAHEKLDRAVFAAYGWTYPLSDEEILEKLLALNLARPGIHDKANEEEPDSVDNDRED